MQVETVHQLAVALSTSPKLYACLLGSGLSRAAGIRTGWEITLDLVQTHAEQLGEGAAAARDPAAWYQHKYDREPDYSDVVAKLAPTAELRRNLLERYFTVHDAVTGARHEHEPTAAHRSIARLVQRGLLRVVVTTNFDRLMETALREAGVARIEVVSSESAAAACYPFHAAEAFVLKLHGDWRDVWLRNSRDELASYPSAIDALVRRIAGEHAWIVCGWSAEYDVALRTAFERRERKFPIVWVDPKPSDGLRGRITALGATCAEAGADAFFSELELAVAALDRQRPPPPLSADVLVARAKRLIAENREMELDELVQDATRGLCRWLEETFEPTFDAPARGPAVTAQMVRTRANELAAQCEQQSIPLARLLLTLARYKQPSYLAQRSLSALLRSAESRAAPRRGPGVGWWWYFGYPALLCAYSHGVACAAQDNWRGAISAVRAAGSGHPVGELHLPPESQDYFTSPMYGGTYGPPHLLQFTNRISAWLFALTEDWIPRLVDFERAFDQFDVMLCVLSLRHDSFEWKPRCSIARDPMDPPSARLPFDAVERWLSVALDQTRNPDGAKSLWDAFPEACKGYEGGIKGYDQLMEIVRRWRPKP